MLKIILILTSIFCAAYSQCTSLSLNKERFTKKTVSFTEDSSTITFEVDTQSAEYGLIILHYEDDDGIKNISHSNSQGSFSKTFAVKTVINRQVTFKLEAFNSIRPVYVNLISDSAAQPIFNNVQIKSFHLEIFFFNAYSGSGSITFSAMGGAWIEENSRKAMYFCPATEEDDDLDQQILSGICTFINLDNSANPPPISLAFEEDRRYGIFITTTYQNAEIFYGNIDVMVGDQCCGNLFKESERDEECDDGNLNSGDGCDSNCKVETNEDQPSDPQISSQSQESSNSVSSSSFTNEQSKRNSKKSRKPQEDLLEAARNCGNGHTQYSRGEECDDGNNIDHDGCSHDCKEENEPI